MWLHNTALKVVDFHIVVFLIIPPMARMWFQFFKKFF